MKQFTAENYDEAFLKCGPEGKTAVVLVCKTAVLFFAKVYNTVANILFRQNAKEDRRSDPQLV